MDDGRRLARMALAGAVLAPSRLLRSAPTTCSFRRLTGRPCPSCGVTRSWNALARGRVRDAFAFHPLGPLTVVAAAIVSVGPPGALDRVVARYPWLVIGFSVAWMGAWLARLLIGSRVRAG
jgi:hypothetical protein